MTKGTRDLQNRNFPWKRIQPSPRGPSLARWMRPCVAPSINLSVYFIQNLTSFSVLIFFKMSATCLSTSLAFLNILKYNKNSQPENVEVGTHRWVFSNEVGWFKFRCCINRSMRGFSFVTQLFYYPVWSFVFNFIFIFICIFFIFFVINLAFIFNYDKTIRDTERLTHKCITIHKLNEQLN